MGGVLDPADEQIIRRCYDSLRRFAAVVGPPVAEPDDLVQEALVRTLRVTPLHQLDNPERYLRRTVVNLARNARRSNRRRDAALLRLRPVDVTADEHPSDLADLDRLHAATARCSTSASSKGAATPRWPTSSPCAKTPYAPACRARPGTCGC